MSPDHHEELSPAGPAEDEMDGQPNATPPLTDGHTASGEAGSQVLLASTVSTLCMTNSNITLCESRSAACCGMAVLLVAR